MGDKLIMSKKELLRKTILDAVISGRLSHVDAAKKLGVCKKTIGRSLKRYRRESDAGLIHRSRGKPSGRAYPEELKEKVLSLYKEKYLDFGPTLASEKLKELDSQEVHPETLRLWLKTAGIWQTHRKRRAHRSRRARRSRFGELLQLDGSIHPWFEGSSEKQCLMNMVDDATSKSLALMDYGETTRAAFSLLKWWIQEAGIPAAIYIDLKSLYVSPKELKEKVIDGEDLIEPEWLTHFSKACKKLGIQVIKAYSPQAKGRVERNHAIYQDRFVKELKLRGINDIEKANELLSGGFINQLNEKFAKPAESDEDAHVALSAEDDLDQIFCWDYERQVSNDWVIRFENCYYQIMPSNEVCLQPKQRVTVRRHLDESISLWYKENRLAFKQLDSKPEKTARPERQPQTSLERSMNAKKNKHKTPWGTFNPDWLKSKRSPSCAGEQLNE